MPTTLQRLQLAFFTLPTTEDWLGAAVLLGMFALISLLIGLQSGFLKVEPLPVSWQTIGRTTAVTFFMPGIVEEVLFRVLLLPHPVEKVSVAVQLYWGAAGLAIYIAAHPLYALTRSSVVMATYKNLIFLMLTGLLGLVCTISYYWSGSLWSPVVLHWLTAAAWLQLLGGYNRLLA